MEVTKAVRMAIAVGILSFGGCAGADHHSAALAPSGLPRPETVALKGTWRGSFTQVGAGDTGQIQGGIVLQVGEDGKYSATWTTQRIAGSARGSSVDTSGTAAATSGAVEFTESSGSGFTLKRVGDRLYGMRRDPVNGRTIAVQLDRDPAGS